MKYVILVCLCILLGYEICVLIKTIIQKINQKRKSKSIQVVKDNKEDN